MPEAFNQTKYIYNLPDEGNIGATVTAEACIQMR
jgi:hypothetical protein